MSGVMRCACLTALLATLLGGCGGGTSGAGGVTDVPPGEIGSEGVGDEGTGGAAGDERVAVDVRVPAIDPGAAPMINGALGVLWAPATSDDVNGEPLAIDRLLSGSAEATTGALPGYRWYAMHDLESLYLFVTFDGAGGRFPSNDSESVFDDDTLNLYVDGNHSRSLSLDDEDRYLALPARAAAGQERPTAVAPAFLAPVVPASLDYRFCVCPGRIGGWELKVSLVELGVTVGQPFGLEVQVDQDIDGGTRDARWGWSNPSRGEREEDYRADSPAWNGTLMLTAPE